MRIDILTPMAFLLLAAVPAIVWVARKSYADLTHTRAKVLVVVRATTLALVAVALAHILLTVPDSALPVSTVFCVDVSDSISSTGQADAEQFIGDALADRADGDRVGLVTFGADATLEVPVSADVSTVELARTGDGGDTDIAAAVRLAALSLPEGTERRIVLWSDGNATRGDTLRAAAEAARLGVRIDIPGKRPAGIGPDVAVAGLDLPGFVRRMQPFEVHVTLVSSARKTVLVKIYVDDMSEPRDEKQVVLVGRDASVTFPVEIAEEGVKRIRVFAETENDARQENNTAEALVKVGPKPSVLVLAGKPEDATFLAEALQKQACDYRLASPDGFKTDVAGTTTLSARERRRRLAADLRHQFDAVIIANLPANNLMPAQIRLITDLAAGTRRPVDGDVLMLRLLHPIAKRHLSQDERREINRMAKLPAKDLTAPDLVLLKNVAGVLKRALPDILRSSLTYEQMLVINRYVHNFGGGLVMVGGKDAFGSGGYYKTPIELALPVYTDPLKEAPVFAIVLIMDKSWSMGDPQMGDISKIDMVKESVIAAIGRLTRKDHLAVISFDTEVHDILAMQRVEDPERMVAEISTMASFGLTNFYPALIKAQRILKATVADYKHAVLLSDGRPSGPDKDYAGQLEKMKKDRIVVSTVGIGVDANKKLLNNIAAWGNGQYYWTDKVKSVPEIILKEMGRLKELLLVEGKFKPRPGPRWRSPFLKDVSVETMPELRGFNRSRAKETAEVQLVISAKDEPLLASWRYGAGCAVAFTSDATDVWCPAWVKPGWRDQYVRFWRQVVLASLQTQRSDSDYRISLVRDARDARVVVDVADRLGRYLGGGRFTGRVSRVSADAVETLKTPVAFEPVAPGRYGAALAVDRESPVLVEVTDAEGREVFTDGGVALATAEHLSVAADETLLETLRSITGGKVVQPEDVFERTGTVTVRRLHRFDTILLTIAAVLFAFDVFIRRLPALMQLFRRSGAAAE